MYIRNPPCVRCLDTGSAVYETERVAPTLLILLILLFLLHPPSSKEIYPISNRISLSKVHQKILIQNLI